MKFSTLGLSAPILQAVTDKGYETPSPIQAQAIPAILEGNDLMAAAQTGTGKTAGFVLPILELLSQGEPAEKFQVRTLILTPTRELSAQVTDSIKTYSKHLDISFGAVYGGVNIKPQISMLKKGVDILVATPGRLMDLWSQKAMKFDKIEILVLDEADRMLDMGFITDIRRVASILPKKRQNLMFSATFSNSIRELAKTLIKEPVEISVSPRNTTVSAISQSLISVDKKKKSNLFMHLMKTDKTYDWSKVLVFCRTKITANKLVSYLELDRFEAAAIHSNKSQGSRAGSLRAFKRGDIQVLVATDIAARGIDIHELPLVVNFDLPNTAEDYIHRIGRTGRAGKEGCALSIVSADDSDMLAEIEELIKEKIPRSIIKGFEPNRDLPDDPQSSGSKKPRPGSFKERMLLEQKEREEQEQEELVLKARKRGTFGQPAQTAKHSDRAQKKSKKSRKERMPGMYSRDQKALEVADAPKNKKKKSGKKKTAKKPKPRKL